MVANPNAQRTLVHQRLYVNIDHVATLRNARGGTYPDPLAAALACEAAGADGITVHLREDRRHIRDADVDALRPAIATVLNLEMACTDEMLAIALRHRPHQVTIVPEKRTEVTTEGGLDVVGQAALVGRTVAALRDAGLHVALFIDPDADAVRRSANLGAHAVELHTGQYAHAPNSPATLAALQQAAGVGAAIGLHVHAGHGLSVENVAPVAAIPEIEELNIGHALVGRALFVGFDTVVREFRTRMDSARSPR
jgi:pyridoxine 5-phosphate synthase